MSGKKDRFTALLSQEGTPGFGLTLSAVLLLAWPAIVEQIMITLVQYVDTAMVGSLGSQATAAVGLTSSTTWLFNGFFAAAAIGFSVQVAQHLGAGRQEDARKVVWQSLRFTVLFGLFMGAIGFALSFPLPALLGADPAVRGDASLYFRIMACAMPFTLGTNMFSAVIRCAGDTKTPMVLNLLINVFNVVLNTLFIYETRPVEVLGLRFTMWGAGWGVGGAAFASGLSTALVCLLFLTVLFRKKSPIRISLKQRYKFERGCLLAAWRLGLPAALERSIMCLAQIVITAIITGNEKALMVAQGIGKKTAQRIILELKDKLAQGQIAPGEESYGGTGVTVIPQDKASEATAALAVLGYGPAEITAALKGLDLETLSLEEIVRQALKNMIH